MEKQRSPRGVASHLALCAVLAAATIAAGASTASADDFVIGRASSANGISGYASRGFLPLVDAKVWRMPDAERPPTDARSVVQSPRTWYGWQTILIDSLSIAAFVASAALESPALAGVGAGIVVFGAPTIHLAHGSYGAAGISVGMRTLAVLLIAGGLALWISDAVDDAADDSSADGVIGAPLAALGVGGLLVAIALDAARFSFELDQSAQIVRVVPWVLPRNGSMGMRISIAM